MHRYREMSAREEILIVIGWKHVTSALALTLLLLVAFPIISDWAGPRLELSTDRTEYVLGDVVKIEGMARDSLISGFKPLSFEPVAVEVRASEDVVWIDQVSTDSSGRFVSSFKLRQDGPQGVYEVYVSLGVENGRTTFSVRG